MNTHEINEVGRRIIHGNYSFKGVFAADTFIESLDISNQLPFAFIVNTDRSESRGRHWVAIIQEHGRFEFFDPLGNCPWHYPNLDIFSVVSYNSHSLQSDFSNTSAHICLIFLSIRSRGSSFTHTINCIRNLFVEYGSITYGAFVIITALKINMHISISSIEHVFENTQTSIAPYLM